MSYDDPKQPIHSTVVNMNGMPTTKAQGSATRTSSLSSVRLGVVEAHVQTGNVYLAKLRHLEQKLTGFAEFEGMWAERIPEDQREPA